MAATRSNPPLDELSVYPSPRWVRGALGGTTVVDSKRAQLVWQPRKKTPVYAFPRDDVDLARLSGDAPSDGEPIVRTYDDPDLSDHVSVAWDALDHWYEEDEEIFVHPRDPFSRVDALASTRNVRVEVDGRVLADSDRAVLLFETGLPTRYYLPREDVDADLLRPSESHTRCPYKGIASYYDVVADRVHRDVVWYYPEPLAAVTNIRDLLAVYTERLDVYVDGEPQRRPTAARLR